MIKAEEARGIINDRDATKQVSDIIEELNRLIQLKAADGGCEIRYAFRRGPVVVAHSVCEILQQHGFEVQGPILSSGQWTIKINW